MTDDILSTPPDNGNVDKRLADKDAHIGNLEGELAELRSELRNRTSLEELVTRIASQAPPVVEPQSSNPQVPNETELVDKVRGILQSEEAKTKRDANIAAARASLIEKYGEDYNNTLKKAAGALGVSEKFLADMAATSPQGLIKVLGTVEFKPDDRPLVTPPPSSVDTSKAFGQQTRKNAAYYTALRKADINKYFSAAVQKEMHDEAIRQGQQFYEP